MPKHEFHSKGYNHTVFHGEKALVFKAPKDAVAAQPNPNALVSHGVYKTEDEEEVKTLKAAAKRDPRIKYMGTAGFDSLDDEDEKPKAKK